MQPVKLSTPRYRVILGDADDPATWAQLTVQAIGRDMMAAETLFHRRKWGTPSTAAIRFTAVSAYYALRRTGQIDGEWEAFDAQCLEVTNADADDDAAEGDDGVGPTGPDPVPG